METVPVATHKALSARVEAYVHEAIRPEDVLERCHKRSAELRRVCVVFIKSEVGDAFGDMAGKAELLQSIMSMVDESLRMHAGHLRQFIIDDKGTPACFFPPPYPACHR
jgi:hypothetical protein